MHFLGLAALGGDLFLKSSSKGSSLKYVFDLFMLWLILIILSVIISKLTENSEKTPIYPLLGICGLWVNFNWYRSKVHYIFNTNRIKLTNTIFYLFIIYLYWSMAQY